MIDRLAIIKGAVALFFAAVGELLGWKGIMLLVLALMMCVDYISGTLAAKRTGTWSSQKARDGIFHKGGTLLVLLVAIVLDVLFSAAVPHLPFVSGTISNPGIFLPLVAAWYIITEIGSVMENAVLMGAPVPAWFAKAVRATGKIVDKAGEAAAPGTEGDDDEHT